MALLHFNFESEYLNNNTDVNIIVPDKKRGVSPAEFYGSGKKYKVLWLLHGTFGDYTDWLRKSNIELYACEKNLIVVMPSALNSNYANWNCMIGYNMYDFLIKELMPLVQGWLPASAAREDNFIAGLSMGGNGALLYALNHPEKFAACAVLSCAPGDFDKIDMDSKEPGMQRTITSALNAGGLEAYKASYENLWRLCGEKAKSGDLPRLYFTVGTNDFLFDRYMEFKAYAKKIGLEAQFREIEGYTHEWRFWDLTIQHALDFFGLKGKDEGNPF